MLKWKQKEDTELNKKYEVIILKKGPETITEIRKKELKLMEKRLKELEEFKHGKNGDGTNNYEQRDEWYRLPKLAMSAINNEIRQLELKINMMKADYDSIRKDLRASIINVLKYYGVEDKLTEIEEEFNRHKETDRLESLLDELSGKIANTVNWEINRRHFY
jgi:hypothetical protein